MDSGSLFSVINMHLAEMVLEKAVLQLVAFKSFYETVPQAPSQCQYERQIILDPQQHPRFLGQRIEIIRVYVFQPFQMNRTHTGNPVMLGDFILKNIVESTFGELVKTPIEITVRPILANLECETSHKTFAPRSRAHSPITTSLIREAESIASCHEEVTNGLIADFPRQQ